MAQTLHPPQPKEKWPVPPVKQPSSFLRKIGSFFIGFLKILGGTLLLLCLLEAGLWIAGFPEGATNFVESIIIRENLTSRKPANEVRIFAFGGSAMHGAHYWPYSSPAKWLELYLRDFLPGKKIRVINFGRMGQEGSAVYNTFEDTLPYHPDIAIFLKGNNQFLPGNRKSQVLEKTSKLNYKIGEWSHCSRLISTINRMVLKSKIANKGYKPEDRMEYDVVETQPGGIGPENAVVLNSPVYKENIEFFRQKVHTIMKNAKKHHVKILFIKPARNLKDFPPGLSVHKEGLSEKELGQWNYLFEQGKLAQASGALESAREFYEKAYAIDSTYADLDFRLGQIYYQAGIFPKAHELFVQACDHDTLKVRATTDIRKVFDEAHAEDNSIALLDSEAVFGPENPGGIIGEPIIEDNVHPSVKGQAMLGVELAKMIAGLGWIAPKEEWKFNREVSYPEMLKRLKVDNDLLFWAYCRMVSYFGVRYENRLRFALKAVEIYPEHPRALRHLAWTYWLMDRKDKALDVYRTLGRLHPADLQEVLNTRPEIREAYEKKFLPQISAASAAVAAK